MNLDRFVWTSWSGRSHFEPHGQVGHTLRVMVGSVTLWTSWSGRSHFEPPHEWWGCCFPNDTLIFTRLYVIPWLLSRAGASPFDVTVATAAANTGANSIDPLLSCSITVMLYYCDSNLKSYLCSIIRLRCWQQVRQIRTSFSFTVIVFVLRLRCPYPVHSVRPVSLFNVIATLCVPSFLLVYM